jgi:hypothetical protein
MGDRPIDSEEEGEDVFSDAARVRGLRDEHGDTACPGGVDGDALVASPSTGDATQLRCRFDDLPAHSAVTEKEAFDVRKDRVECDGFGAEADADVGSGAQQSETVLVDRLRHMDVRARHGQQATRAT